MHASHFRLSKFVVIAIVCLLLIGAGVAQTLKKDVKTGKEMLLVKHELNQKITPGLEIKITSAKAQEELPVIIFFKKKDGTETAKIMAQSAAVSAVEAKGGKVKHRYTLVDAVSARMTAVRIEELAASGDIERIYYDEVIPLPPTMPGKPALTNSTQTIGANYVWDELGYTGTGVKVAVVDTGINYSHSDLGGGFGQGYRVIGGYDFYNEDTNPMDDDGHGTHVAGIIGANGTIKGVAPNVSFYAVKVCGSGSVGCPTSDILAGIDWSVANGADVISMSLGGPGQPTDEFDVISIVSDAAVDKGIVVAVAAGNEGPGTGTISHPGSSKKVITVGASDDKNTNAISDDIIASFSNRGPSAFGRLDPEVVAPGVNIYSTYFNGSYTSMSGTSMATPHVSGAAALLLQKNPSLAPAEIRRILMHTASNLTAQNIHVFEKGAGIINVTKALTYNISARINDDDRWEESVIPGFSTIAMLNLTNGNTDAVNFTLALEGITDLEGDHSLPSSSFSLPGSALVPAMSSGIVNISLTVPANAKPAIYGSTLVISNETAGTLRIPIVIVIPLLEAGMINGTVNNQATKDSACLYFPSYCNGDWIYSKLKTYNGTKLYAVLNWSIAANDLDMYLIAPNGEFVNYSLASSGTSEQVTLSNMVYDEYWIAVHAYNLSGTVAYNLTVNYPSGSKGNLQVAPSSWKDVVSNSEVKNITFSITNDATAKPNLNLSVKKRMPGGSNFSSGTIPNTLSNYSIKWDVLSSGMNLNNTRYMNVTLQWTNSSNDLDLILGYYDGVQWWGTRFESTHNNSVLNESWENLENVDIQHYLKNYPNFGIGIANSGNDQAYNLTINFTDIAPWNAAGVNLTQLSLGAGETKQVVVSINGSVLEPGKTYDAFFTVQNSTEDFASVPLRITADGTTVNQCTNLNTPGYYTLTGSIMNSSATNCINITSSNVTFDGAGYTIDGVDNSSTVGIQAHNQSVILTNITVKNLTVTDWGTGTIYIDVLNGSITDNTANSNTNIGMLLQTVSNNTLINNSMTNNKYNFDITGSQESDFNNTINQGNVVEGKPIFYFFKNGSNNVYDSTTNAGAVYCILCSNVSVKDLTFTKNGAGVFFWGTNNSKIENVTTTLNKVGIKIAYSNNTTLASNNVSSNINGIYLTYSGGNTLSNITALSNAQYGTAIYYSNNNTLTNGNVSMNGGGITLEESNNNTFSNITANSNFEYGITLMYSSSNTFININSSSNTWDFYSILGSINNSGINFSIPLSISFTGKDIALKSVSSPSSDPSGYNNLSKYINATNTSADSWLFLNVSYTESDISGLNENLLRMWKHNGSWSMLQNSGVETSQNYVYANITSFGIFAPMAGTYGANLTVTPQAKTTKALTNATYYLNLTNNGTEADSYSLTVDNSSSASVAHLNISSQVDLTSGSSQIFTLNVTNTTSGKFYVNITASSNNDSSKVAHINTTTTIPVVINITAPANNTNTTDNYVNVTVKLDNNGMAQLNWQGQNHTMNGTGADFWKNMTGLLSGNYSFRVYANGSDGIMNVSETRIVNVNLTNTTNISASINQTNGNLSSDVILISPSGNVTVTIFNGTNATVNGTAPGNLSIDSPAQINATLTGYDRFAGENLTLDPSETRFIPDIKMRFNYTDAQLTAAGIEGASTLRIISYNTTSLSWVVLTTYTLDQTGKYITANASYFGAFSLIGTASIPCNTCSGTTSSGGGGGGGGGGGASAENYSNIELKEKRDNYVFKDKVASYKFNTTDPIMYVNITGNISAGDVTTMVEVLKNTSTLVKNTSAPGIVYKNMNIWVGTSGFAIPKNMKQGVVGFRVRNQWLEEKELASGDVRLVKWNGIGWIELDTYETTKGSEHVYYEAVTDSFSPFAITAFKSDVPVEAVKTPVTAQETQAPEEIDVKRKETSGLNGILLMIAVVLVIIVAILAAVHLRDKKKI